MKDLILNFPKQISLGLKAAKDVKTEGNFKAVLICAMGGSALPGDILELYFQHEKVKAPLFVNRDYNLPHRANKNHLVVCISYSGDAEETLSCYLQALKLKLPLVAITSGGQLGKLCDKNSTPWVQIPAGLPPRMALGYMASALFQILNNCKITSADLEKLENLEKSLDVKNLELAGKNLAKKIKSEIPLIYASWQNKSLARIWKILFNENSKIPAYYNCFPELNHNEISFLESPLAKFQIFLLKEINESQKIEKRMELTEKIAKRQGAGFETITLEGKNIFEKIFSNIILAYWTSYYTALFLEKDPIETKLQDEVKNEMQKN